MCHQNTEISFNDLLPSATKGNITIEKDFTETNNVIWCNAVPCDVCGKKSFSIGGSNIEKVNIERIGISWTVWI